MVQSNALTKPFIILVASTSLSLVQPMSHSYYISANYGMDQSLTTTRSHFFKGEISQRQKIKQREQALLLFGHQSGLTSEERNARKTAIRKISKNTGLNIFDMYGMKTSDDM